MNFQSICPMIVIIINLTIVTATSTDASNTIEHEVTSSPPASLPSTLSTSRALRTGKHFIDDLVANGTLDLLPGKQIIKLLDSPTQGLISKTIYSLKDSDMDKVTLIGLSSVEVLRLVEKQSSGAFSSTLNDLKEKDLIERWNQLKSTWSAKVKRAGPDSMSGWTLGSSKRSVRSVQPEEFTGTPDKKNFDEIDRSGFVGFVGKRNFDEIDRSGFVGFTGKRNFDEIDRSGLAGFRGKKNFDEIDRSSFNGFTGGKRDNNNLYGRPINPQSPAYYYLYSPQKLNKKNFDEIDRTGLTGFRGRRNFDEIDSSGFTGFYKRNFDEIDNSGFTGFVGKRNFDEIDRSAFNGFVKRPNDFNGGKQKVNNIKA